MRRIACISRDDRLYVSMMIWMIESLDSLEHFLDDVSHDGLSLDGSLLHLLVGRNFLDILTAEVGDNRDAEHAEAAMVGYDDFRHGRHTDGITADDTEILILSRGLESGAGSAYIDAMHQTDVIFFGDLIGENHEVVIVSLGHGRETGTKFLEILATEGILGEEVDMVGDDHNIADDEILVHTAGSIADEESFDTKFTHHTHRESDLLHVVTFIIVETPLHSHDILAAKVTEDEFTGVTLNGRNGEIGDVMIIESALDIDMVNEFTEACAKDDSDFGEIAHLLTDESGGFTDNFQIRFFHYILILGLKKCEERREIMNYEL